MRKIFLVTIVVGILFVLVGGVSAGTTYTPSTETFCEYNGYAVTCWTNFYSGTIYTQHDGEWVTLPEISSVNWQNGAFRFSYNDGSIWFDIAPFVVYNGQEKSIGDIKGAFPNVNLKDYIKVEKNVHKFALNFTNVPQHLLNNTDYIGLRLVGAHGLTWDDVKKTSTHSVVIKDKFEISYQDLLDSHFTLNMPDKRTLLIGNISANSENGMIYLDPTIQLADADTEILEDADTYFLNAFSVPEESYSYIKFDMSPIPSGSTITNASLYLYRQSGDGAADINVSRVNNQTWREENHYTDLDAMPVTNSSLHSSKWTSSGYDFVYVTDIVKEDFDIANNNVSLRLTRPNLENASVHDTGRGGHTQMEVGGEGINTNYWTFGTKEFATVGQRPYLQVSYYVGTAFSACRNLDVAGATYTLTNDITNDGNTTCINITASNIILECDGYTIDGVDGASTSGIHLETDVGNITIQNAVITDWGVGYNETKEGSGVSGNTILNTEITSCTKAAYSYTELFGNDAITFTNVTIEDNANGIHFEGEYADDHVIRNSTIRNNTNYGVYYEGAAYSDSNQIYNNIFNNTLNVKGVPEYTPYSTWNTTKAVSTNIIGRGYIGGNFWAHPNGTGFSRNKTLCSPDGTDGVCINPYTVGTNNIDYLALTYLNNTPPTTPTLISPSNGSHTNDTTPFFNWTDSDADGDTLTRYIEIDNEITFASPLTYSNYTITQSNFTLPAGDALSEGLYYWRVRSNDGYINSSWATHFNFTVDITLPLIEMDSVALNTSKYFKNPIKVNYTITETNQNRTWYNVSNSTAVIVANTTITSNTTFTLTVDGLYTLTVYADDEAGNENSTTITNFKADITAPTITNGAVSPASVLTGVSVTITCDVNDTYAGVDVDRVTVRVVNPDEVATNNTMTHGTGDTYSVSYGLTGASGTYTITHFYAYDNATGSGNMVANSSTLYFNAVTHTGGSGGGGSGGGSPGVTILNETTIELFKEPIHLFEKLLQRFFFYSPFKGLEQDRLIQFAGADKELESCLSSEGECIIDPVDPHLFHVLYTQDSDDFFLKRKIINITVFDTEEYANYARLDIYIINLGAYMPIPPSRLWETDYPQKLNALFKLEYDVDGTLWITGVRLWWLVLVWLAVGIGAFSMVDVKKKKKVKDWF